MVPLVQFADCVRSISSTRLDLAGVGDLEFPRPLTDKLREFDEVFSWYGSNRPEFRSAMCEVQRECKFFQALPPDDSSEHAVDFFLRQVGAPPGATPKIAVEATTPRQSLVIHPFSGSARKNWPLDRYRELVDKLALPVEWTAGPEEELAGAIRFHGLQELARWMGGARIYLGNDSGISHLAAAIGLPTVVLFGPTNPAVWGPRGESVRLVAHQPLAELVVEEVLQEVLGL